MNSGHEVARHGEEPATQPIAQDLLVWAESLAGIARTGLGFTESLYEQERFEEVLRVAAQIRRKADRVEDHPEDHLVSEWLGAVGNGVVGYVTPKLAVGAVVGNEKGQILLIQRSDSGVWLYPTGWADVGYSAAEVAAKEVLEETGIVAKPKKLIGVLDSLRWGVSRFHFYSMLFYCEAVGGELSPHPLETADLGWFDRDNLPSPLAGAPLWKSTAFAAIDGVEAPVLFDMPNV